MIQLLLLRCCSTSSPFSIIANSFGRSGAGLSQSLWQSHFRHSAHPNKIFNKCNKVIQSCATAKISWELFDKILN